MHYFLACRNGSEAARQAGYSQKTAAFQARDLLKNPHIKAAIDAAEQKRFQALQMTGDEILSELAHLSRSRMTNYVSYGRNKRIRLTPSSQLTDAQAAAIKSIKETETTTEGRDGTKVKRTLEFTLHDKIVPLKALGTAAGVLTDRSETTVNIQSEESRHALAEKLAEVRRRLEERNGAGGDAGPGPGGDEAIPGESDTGTA